MYIYTGVSNTKEGINLSILGKWEISHVWINWNATILKHVRKSKEKFSNPYSWTKTQNKIKYMTQKKIITHVHCSLLLEDLFVLRRLLWTNLINVLIDNIQIKYWCTVSCRMTAFLLQDINDNLTSTSLMPCHSLVSSQTWYYLDSPLTDLCLMNLAFPSRGPSRLLISWKLEIFDCLIIQNQ